MKSDGTSAAALVPRPADIDDVPEIRALAERIWRESYAKMLSPAQIDYMLAWMYGAEKIAAELAAGVLWRMAMVEGTAVGFLSVTIHDPATAELNKLYLLPSLQGHGYGQVLLDDAVTLAAAHGCITLRLRVNKTNDRALRAYRRAGFVKVNEVVADIGGGYVMDDYVLARPVGPDRSAAQRGHSPTE